MTIDDHLEMQEFGGSAMDRDRGPLLPPAVGSLMEANHNSRNQAKKHEAGRFRNGAEQCHATPIAHATVGDERVLAAEVAASDSLALGSRRNHRLARAMYSFILGSPVFEQLRKHLCGFLQVTSRARSH